MKYIKQKILLFVLLLAMAMPVSVYAKEKGCSMQGTEDPEVENLNVLAKK